MEKQTQIREQLEFITNVIVRLSDCIDRLINKLHTVLKQTPKKEDKQEDPPELMLELVPELVPLAYELRTSVLNLEQLEDKLNSIIDSIEL